MCEEAPSNSVHGVSKHGMMRNIVASNLGSISESMNASEGKSPSIFSATSLPQTNSPMKEDNRMEPSRPSDGMVSVTLPSNIQLVPSELDASSNSALLAHGGTKGGLPRRQRMIADEEDKVKGGKIHPLHVRLLLILRGFTDCTIPLIRILLGDLVGPDLDPSSHRVSQPPSRSNITKLGGGCHV